MTDEILKYIENVNVSSNELVTRTSLNRNLLKLLENDKALLDYSGGVDRGLYRILPWEKGKTYDKNDLVWYVGYYVVPKNIVEYEREMGRLSAFDFSSVSSSSDLETLSAGWQRERQNVYDKYHIVTLFLLRSLDNLNSNEPELTMIDMIPTFDASGWKNENQFGTIYYDYFEDFTAHVLKDKLHEMHEVIKKYHKFGTLSSFSEIDNKVLKTDFSNLSENRSSVFFPYETITLDPSGSIVEGTMRKWDCGLIEYDLIYKLGDTSGGYIQYAADGSLIMHDNVAVNYLNLNPIVEVSDPNLKYDNSPYYLTENDADIFVVPGEENAYSTDVKQTGLNSVVNTYCGTITFPIAFADTNYMVFGTEIACIDSGNGDGAAVANVNTTIYVNKAKKSITAVLIVPTYDSDVPRTLVNNRFRCHVVGRWKL